ncbi:MAG: sodium-dependent transporter [Anaerovoracaceae bacterium]
METNRGFNTRIGYILSMAGFCIGIGNMWKFPYMVGANGGGVFLLCYTAIVLLVGIPLFIIEVQLGRSSGLSGISGMEKLEGKKNHWCLIGWIGFITVFLIGSYLITIIGGWNLGYIFKIASGSLETLGADEIAKTFYEFSGSGKCIMFTGASTILVWLIMNTGAKDAVEKVCTYVMPLLLLMLVALAIYANTLPGSREGLIWYLKPNFSAINLNVIQAAAMQSFYSIGVGMCCGFVYGSYIGEESNLIGDTIGVALLDTGVAILAGLVLTPALFAYDIDPTTGAPLIFITLPHMFNAMGPVVGKVFGISFMFAVFIAGITSWIGILEACEANLIDKYKWSRKKTNAIVCFAMFISSILMTASKGNGMLSNIRIGKWDIFDFADFIASSIGLTIGAMLLLAYVVIHWGFDKFRNEINKGAGKIRIYSWMKAYYCYVLPVILLIICYGIIDSYIG